MPTRPSSRAPPRNKDVDRAEDKEQLLYRNRQRARSEDPIQRDGLKEILDKHQTKDELSQQENNRGRRYELQKQEKPKRRGESLKREKSKGRYDLQKQEKPKRRGESLNRVRSRSPSQTRSRSVPAISRSEDTEMKIRSGFHQQIFKECYSTGKNSLHYISVHVEECLFGRTRSHKSGIYECLLVFQVFVEKYKLYDNITIQIEYEPEDHSRQLVELSDFGPIDHVANEAIEQVTRTQSISAALEASFQVNFNLAVNVAKESTLQINHKASITGSKTMKRKRGELKFIATAEPKADLAIPSNFKLWGKFEYKNGKGLKLRVIVTAITHAKLFRKNETTYKGKWHTVEKHKGDVKDLYDVSRIIH